MSDDDSNNQTTNQQDHNNQPTVEGLNWSNATAFINQPANLIGFQPGNGPSGFQFVSAPSLEKYQSAVFQQAPYSGPSQSMSFQQSNLPGTFQCNNYFPPQTTPSFTQSLFSPLPTSTSLNLNNNPESSQRTKKRASVGGEKKKIVWTTEEDIELCVAWLKISEDAIVGTNQKKCYLWDRIMKQFNNQMSRINAVHVERSSDGCSSRWKLIHPAVTKWTGMLAQATRNVPSGWNQSQIESQARHMYQVTYGEYFVFEECWKILKDTYKWQTWSVKHGEPIASGRSGSSKRTYAAANSPMEDTRNTDAPSASLHTDSPQSLAHDTPQSVAPDDPQFVSVDTPESMAPKAACSGKSSVPPLYGPSRKKRPPGVKISKAGQADEVKNGRQRAKQRFVDAQNEGAEKISAALLTIDKDVEQRARRAEEARHERDEVMRLHLEAESNRANEEHMLKKEQHAWMAASKRATFVKDLVYVTEKLKDASRQLELIEHSSVRTPQEQFDYNVSKELVEALQSERTELKKLLAILSVKYPEPCTPSLKATTVEISERQLDDERWNVDLQAD